MLPVLRANDTSTAILASLTSGAGSLADLATTGSSVECTLLASFLSKLSTKACKSQTCPEPIDR